MPRLYPPEQKAAALQRLQANGGDTLAAHFETGIPQRTLYNWRLEQQVLRRQTPPPLPQKEIPAFADAAEGLIMLYQEIIEILYEINRSPLPLTPYRMVDRVRAQTGLLDCILKLDKVVRPHLKARQQESQAQSPLANWSRWDTLEEIVEP
jgi:hypothetical protein